MPPQSRAQRRQQNTRRATTSPNTAARPASGGDIDQTLLEAAEAEVAAEPLMQSLPPRGAVTRAPRQSRRPIVRPTAEPIDYTADYIGARSDMIKIAIWSALLFAAMIAIKLSGLV
jgi:hypothetical protein